MNHQQIKEFINVLLDECVDKKTLYVDYAKIVEYCHKYSKNDHDYVGVAQNIYYITNCLSKLDKKKYD